MFISIFMRVLVFVFKLIIVRILSLKEGNFGENFVYGIGIFCKYMYEYFYIVFLFYIKCNEIMLFNMNFVDKLYIIIINIGNSLKWEKIY